MTSAGRRIFVVEDDEGMREAMESLLGAAGYETASFASAEAMLADETVGDAACVISDLKLPAMSGLDLLAQLKSHAKCPPVIVITAHDSPGVRHDAEQHGAAACLAKPFAGSVLLSAIDEVTRLDRPKEPSS